MKSARRSQFLQKNDPGKKIISKESVAYLRFCFDNHEPCRATKLTFFGLRRPRSFRTTPPTAKLLPEAVSNRAKKAGMAETIFLDKDSRGRI
jgi:hypothetical protein